MSDPLVLTLVLDEQAQARFDAERRAHFPPERLVVGAHVTLFHALPDDEQVRRDVAAAADRPAFPLQVKELRSLGRGVAYVLDAPEALALRAGIARGRDLTRQDAGKRELHVTVQNKVEPAAARALLAELQAGFAPYEVTATGLALWRYRGGPWEHLQTWPFRS